MGGGEETALRKVQGNHLGQEAEEEVKVTVQVMGCRLGIWGVFKKPQSTPAANSSGTASAASP